MELQGHHYIYYMPWEEDFVLEKSYTMQQELFVWIWKLQVQATIFTAA